MPHYLFLLANQWFSFQFCLLSNTWWTRWPKKKSHIWGKICLIARWNYVESRDGRDSWATFPYLSFNLYIFFKWFPILLFQLVKDYQAWASGDASRKPLGTGEIWSCPVAPLGMIVYSLNSVIITPSFVSQSCPNVIHFTQGSSRTCWN